MRETADGMEVGLVFGIDPCLFFLKRCGDLMRGRGLGRACILQGWREQSDGLLSRVWFVRWPGFSGQGCLSPRSFVYSCPRAQ